jgi:hypothetical protein
VTTVGLGHPSANIPRRVFHNFFIRTDTIFPKSLKRWWARQGLNL